MQKFFYFLSGMVFTAILYMVFSFNRDLQDSVPGKGIDREYYLEVSEDSIWVESMQGRIYSGKYSDLDSLITADNL